MPSTATALVDTQNAAGKKKKKQAGKGRVKKEFEGPKNNKIDVDRLMRACQLNQNGRMVHLAEGEDDVMRLTTLMIKNIPVKFT